jgi:hypothetical protein
MSPDKDLERRIADHYVAESPSGAPDWVLERILASVDMTPQRGIAGGRPWRIPTLSSARARLGVTAVAIATVGLVALALPWGPVMGPAASPSPSPSPAVSVEPTSSGGMWPQSSLEEVRQAQQLADAGDTRYTWQFVVSGAHIGQHHPRDSERFFARFLEEVLGWADYRWNEAFAHPDGLVDGDVVYIRCAPGGANPLYPDDPDGGCAPTIDGLRYETVKINVAQLDRQGFSGIWVVTAWEMIEPAEQIAPPTDADIAASLGAFLQARIDGEGAEGLADFAEFDPYADERVDAEKELPLLYATSSGAPYARSEIERVDGPVWPSGRMQFETRLFTQDGDTVVEQVFSLERDGTGRLRVVHDFQPTMENGQPVPVAYGFLDGAVTYRPTPPLAPSQDGYRDRNRLAIDGLLPDDDAPRRVLLFLADPRPIGPGCVEGPAPSDAEALARSIGSDPDFEATAPVAVTVGGLPALRLDVVLRRGMSSCTASGSGVSGYSPLLKHAPFGIGMDRARIYLVDLPGGPARVLGLVTITDQDSFETVLGFAERVVDSIEFHAP